MRKSIFFPINFHMGILVPILIQSNSIHWHSHWPAIECYGRIRISSRQLVFGVGKISHTLFMFKNGRSRVRSDQTLGSANILYTVYIIHMHIWPQALDSGLSSFCMLPLSLSLPVRFPDPARLLILSLSHSTLLLCARQFKIKVLNRNFAETKIYISKHEFCIKITFIQMDGL